MIAEVHGKKVRLIGAFGWLLRLIGLQVGIVKKVFGNLVYEKSMSDYKVDYRIRDFRESIELTELGTNNESSDR